MLSRKCHKSLLSPREWAVSDRQTVGLKTKPNPSLWAALGMPETVPPRQASTQKLSMGPATLPRQESWPWRLSEVLQLVPRTRRLIELCLDEPGFPLASWKNAFVHSISWGHFKETEKVLVVQPCPTDPKDYSPPGSSVRGILQARILEWVAMPSSRASSRPRDGTRVSYIAGNFFTI